MSRILMIRVRDSIVMISRSILRGKGVRRDPPLSRAPNPSGHPVIRPQIPPPASPTGVAGAPEVYSFSTVRAANRLARRFPSLEPSNVPDRR